MAESQLTSAQLGFTEARKKLALQARAGQPFFGKRNYKLPTVVVEYIGLLVKGGDKLVDHLAAGMIGQNDEGVKRLFYLISWFCKQPRVSQWVHCLFNDNARSERRTRER